MPIMDDLALSGHSFFVGEHAAGMRACERVLSSLTTDENEAKARRNRTWYTPTLADLVGQRNVEWSRIDVRPPSPGWSLFNPSVCADDDGSLLCIVRSSNYRIVEGGRYVMPPEDGGRIRTRNVLTRIRTGPKVEEVSSMELLGPGYPESDFPIEGLEDLRLFRQGDQWKVSGTVCNVLGADCTRRIATATLLPDVGFLCDFALTPEVVPGRNEKNWMPIPGHDQWLYSCWEDGQTTTVRADGSVSNGGPPAPLIARGFRGGSQLIGWQGGEYLACIHEVATLKNGQRVYEHRFVSFEENVDGFRISGLSDPFVFQEKRAIEFCAGAALVTRWDGRPSLALSYGVRDAEAWIAFVDPWAVKKIMRRV